MYQKHSQILLALTKSKVMYSKATKTRHVAFDSD